jgi:hypothetical protein
VIAALAAALVAHGAGFSIPIPTGFSEAPEEAAASIHRAGGVLLVQKAAPALPSAMAANIVVTAVKPGELDSAGPSGCARLSRRWVKDGATIEKQGIVPALWGPVCQIDLTNPKKHPHGGSRITIVALNKKFSTITCNYDLRDDAALGACDKVVAGFRMQ